MPKVGGREIGLTTGINRKNLVFHGYLQPGAAYFAILFFSLILLFNGFPAFINGFKISDFFASYITVPVVIMCFFGWKVYKKTSIVPLDLVDLSRGPAEALRGTRYEMEA